MRARALVAAVRSSPGYATAARYIRLQSWRADVLDSNLFEETLIFCCNHTTARSCPACCGRCVVVVAMRQGIELGLG